MLFIQLRLLRKKENKELLFQNKLEHFYTLRDLINNNLIFGYIINYFTQLVSKILFFERLFELCKDPIQFLRLSTIIVIDKFIKKEGFPKICKYLKYLLHQFIDDRCKKIQFILNEYIFVIQKTKKRLYHVDHVNGHLEGNPEFDKKIEQILFRQSLIILYIIQIPTLMINIYFNLIKFLFKNFKIISIFSREIRYIQSLYHLFIYFQML
ncbi:unnamed protein product [Paramecium sonneborni]|uniref:Uncharacterized protein n=1 Tax=Paramecium sonneborni TaxID=65129 RepID=A0A8S1RN14_9CILI|nr:unnamed protein product [Paramecium sonneborni]